MKNRGYAVSTAKFMSRPHHFETMELGDLCRITPLYPVCSFISRGSQTYLLEGEDLLNSGVQDQPGQHSETLTPQKIKLAGHNGMKAFPKRLSFLNGFLGSTTKAFPGVLPSFSPYITAMKESVVGSGPILMPGKSCSNGKTEASERPCGLPKVTMWTFE
ncbi:hypothetical protein AAY473_029301 [Plecturocebus cupreus]